MLGAFLRLSPIRRVLSELPVTRRAYVPWERTHPFDREYNVETSGFVPVERIHQDSKLQALINPYAASQPSIVRAAFTSLGNVEEYNFVDLGCGKGRATLVATEFPFAQIVGVELSSDLAKVARRNAAIVAKRFFARTQVTIHTGNMLEYEPAKGKLVVFFYHSLRRPLLLELLKKLEALLASGHNSHMFVVYQNPVLGAELDALPSFTRWFAKTLPYAPTELGFGPDQTDTVVIWQSQRGALVSPHPDRMAKIVEVHPDWKAGLAESAG